MTSLPNWRSEGTSSATHSHADELPHLVQFYGSESELSEAVTEFLSEGLITGVPALVIARAEHWAAFRRALLASGVDVEKEVAAGRLLALDAHSVLGEIMVNESPDWERFVAKVEPLLEHAMASADPAVDHVRAYGELVDILWKDDKHVAALALEDMWNELAQIHRFSLYCAYSLGGFYKQSGDVEAVRQRHSGVRGKLEREALAEGIRSLSAELAQRREIERELRRTISGLAQQKQALHRVETELRDFVDNAVLPLDVVDPEGRITWANRAQLETLGYSAEEYVGKLAAEFHVDPHEGAEMSARLRRAHVLNAFPACLRAKDGSLRFVETSSSVYQRDGAVLYSRRFNRDVTAQRLAQRAQAQQELRAERLKRITAIIADAVTTDEVFDALVDHAAEVLEAATSAMWLIDEQRQIARLAKARGYAEPLSSALASVPLDASTPVGRVLVEREPFWCDSRAALRASFPNAAEAADAGNLTLAVLPLAAQGKVLGALALTFSDQRKLDAAERNLLLLVARSSSQALERWRLLSSERENRRRAELLYGLAAAVMDADAIEHIFDAALDAIESALGADRASILLFDPDDVIRFKAWRNLSSEYRAAVEGHCPWPRDARSPQPIVSSDVERDEAMLPYLPLFRREGIGALGFIPLVSGGRLIGKFMVYYTRPRQLASSELHLARAIANHVAAAVVRFNSISELQRTVRFNEMFSGILGHDLRNPLNAIMMAAQTALLRDDGELQRRSFNKIVASGSRMARMIEQLLDFTRVRLGGGIPVVAREADILLIVRHAIDELEAANPNHKFRLTHEHDTRGVWDTDRLAQVFSNLLGNAVQHGDVSAGIDVVIDGKDADLVSITVQNRGSIPSELLNDIFEPLCGGEPRAGSRGLGLGLFITRELVRAHGGDIRVHSEVSDGTTTFSVALPRAERLDRPRDRLWAPSVT